MGNARSMSLGPEAAAVVTKAITSMPSPPMIETGIFAAGTAIQSRTKCGDENFYRLVCQERPSSSMPEMWPSNKQTYIACLRDIRVQQCVEAPVSHVRP